MSRNHLLSCLLAVATLATPIRAVAQAPGGGSIADLFETAMEPALAGDVTAGILLPVDQKVIETIPMPVDGGVKYKLTIPASVDSDFVVEKDYRSHIRAYRSFRYSLASHCQVIFLDENGEPVPGLLKQTPVVLFLTSSLHPYTLVFYTPSEAKSIKAVFTPNRQPTRLAGIKLEKETEEASVNPNPDFRYGELNYCGWNSNRDGRLFTRPDGNTIFKTGYTAGSAPFPVDPAKKYRIFIKGEGGRVSIRYYDAEGKDIVKRAMTPKAEGVELETSPPEGAKIANFQTLGGNLILDEIRLIEQ